MAAHFKNIGLGGFGRWMECQALEELTHAMKFYGFLNERGAKALLKPIEGPPVSWENPLAVFEEVYSHEVKVTGLIHNLVDLAIKEKDHASNNFLQWFVSEQVEEEASAGEVLQKLKLVEGAQGGLFMLDQELGLRTFAVPPGTTFITVNGA
jgi:ferritin